MPVFTLGLLTMAVAQLLDFTTFAMMMERLGPGSEANPLVAQLVDSHGIVLVALGKAAVVLFVASVAVLLGTRNRPASHRRLAAIVVAIAIIAGIVGGGSNALTIGSF